MSWDTEAHLKPPADPAERRTLVLLHGTGGRAQEMLELGRELAPRLGRFAPTGKESENGHARWFRRHAEGVFDVPNLIQRTGELANDVLAALPDPSVRIAVGFSNGANVAAAALLLRPEAFHHALLIAAMVPLEPETLPDLTGKRIRMVQGRQDPIVPVENAQRLADMLSQAGAEVELDWHPAGHGFPPAAIVAAKAWLAER